MVGLAGGGVTLLGQSDPRWRVHELLHRPGSDRPKSITPPPAKPTTQISFHYQAGGDNNALLDILKHMHDVGKPIAGILLMRYGWGGELNPGDIKAVSPETEVMCRPWQTNEVQPDWSRTDLYALGRALPGGCQPEAGVDFWQHINEPGYGVGTAVGAGVGFWLVAGL